MIKIDGNNLLPQHVYDISYTNADFELTTDARDRMQLSRNLVDRFVNNAHTIYGINTGFGPLSGYRVSEEALKEHQVNLLHHLSTGQGDLFSEEETRAIMVSRVNALAKGYSGIRVEVIENILNGLRKGLLPEIPTEGSVGASGDLVPLAHMARVFSGIGWAKYKGERLPATEALQKAGLKPIELKSKEGLALVNGTSAMTGIMSLAVVDVQKLLNFHEFLSSCLIQVMYGEPEVLCGQLHRARGHKGQISVAKRMAEYLCTHERYEKEINNHHWGMREKPVKEGIEIQDPYSMRCAPQVLGACQDVVWHVEQVVTCELNASTDNPLIFPETEIVIHGGNFYGQQISFAADYLRLSIVKMLLLSERQIDRLLNWRYSQGLSPMLTGANPGLNSGMAGCQLMATSLAAEARMLTAPASIQSIPTNGNNQDVVSMGMTAARYTKKVLPMAWKIAAVETMALVQAAELRNDDTVMGKGYKKLFEKVRTVFPKLNEDRPLNEEIEHVRDLICSDDFQNEILQVSSKNPWMDDT
ncbi:MAG: aromatic amino acid ammonia-lyase [Desulfobacterales bacterium]|nr:aromatic amino acid ammonia-lyase [Desulfobacterales bacterium]